MPLLRISQEFRDTLLEDPIFKKRWDEFLTEYEYLGTDIRVHPLTQIYLVKSKQLKPGEYWVDIVVTVIFSETNPDEIVDYKLSFSIL